MIQCALLSASAVKTVFKSCLSMLNYKMCKGKMSQDPFGRMLPFWLSTLRYFLASLFSVHIKLEKTINEQIFLLKECLYF